MRCAYLIQIDGANSSHMGMCIEFLVQVPKQKNVHVLFLLECCTLGLAVAHVNAGVPLPLKSPALSLRHQRAPWLLQPRTTLTQ